MYCTEELTTHRQEDFKAFDAISDHAKLLKSIVIPRPIAFVTSLGENGVVNAAPFSYFNAVSTNPPIIYISVDRREGEPKDTSRNISKNGEFVVNLCSVEIGQALGVAARELPPHESEIEAANLSLISSETISVPRIANTLAQMECRLNKIIEIGDGPTDLILGNVVKIHLHKKLVDEKGHVDAKKLNPLARLAGLSYGQIDHFFEIS